STCSWVVAFYSREFRVRSPRVAAARPAEPTRARPIFGGVPGAMRPYDSPQESAMGQQTSEGVTKIEVLAAASPDPCALLGQIIHDLRGPLATLGMELYSADALRSRLAEPARSQWGDILENLARMQASLGGYVQSLQRARETLRRNAIAPAADATPVEPASAPS